MSISTNSAPWYDDFDQTKGFHEILFKPGVSVQARELTQLQTILAQQISKFGNHIFQQGSVVIPGNAQAELSVDYITVNNTFGGVNIDPTAFLGQTLVSVISGVTAVVKLVAPAVLSDPHTFYLAYTSGSGSSLSSKFVDGESVYINGQSSVQATLSASSSSGYGSLVNLAAGVFFINGRFVYTTNQTSVIGKYTSLPSCHVMLKITESIVTSDSDFTLLDPANGSYNYAAPGADRFKVDLALVAISLDAAITEDYVELMRFNNGIMQQNNRYAKYSELEKSLARRTSDESGDYRVNGFDLKIRDDLQTAWNNGVSLTGDRAKFDCDISSGKAYINGFETEVIYTSRIQMNKARTSDHIKSKLLNVQGDYGKFVYVTDVKTLPNFTRHQTVTLYDTSNLSGSPVSVGTAMSYGIKYVTGDPTTVDAIYGLYFHNAVFVSGNDWSSVGGIQWAGGSMTVLQRLTVPVASADFAVNELVNTLGTVHQAKVKRYNRATGDVYVHRYDNTKMLPINGEIITGVTSQAIATIRKIDNAVTVGTLPVFPIPVTALKALKDNNNLYNASYTTWKTFTITTNGSGTGAFVLSSGLFTFPDPSLVVASFSGGAVSPGLMSITAGGTTLNIVGSACVSGVISVMASVTKTLGQPKTKTLNQAVINNISPATSISLGKCDIYQLTQIIDSTGLDVTSRYQLDNGQTDYFYGVGSLNLRGILPTSNLTVSFSYFSHSGSGDFYSVDSYATLGSDYQGIIPSYQSRVSSIRYPLRDCIDFRPRMGDDGTFTGTGASLSDTLMVSSPVSTNVQYYVPRVDTVYLSKNGVLDAVTGTPAEAPLSQPAPAGTLELYRMFIPAYTNSIDDIIVTKSRTDGYTMKAISKLEDRVANVEYFSTLTASEQNLLTYQVPDAVTGLNRFKTGYLVDNFRNPFSVCDFYSTYRGCQFTNNQMSPALEYHQASLVVDSSSSNYQITGNQVTLPYVEVPFINQNTSTRVTNINHFLIISWSGVMTIDPPIDNWIDTEFLPEIFNTINNTVVITEVNNIYIQDAPLDPVPAPAPPAAQTIGIAIDATWLGLPPDGNNDGRRDGAVFQVPSNAVVQLSPGIYQLASNISVPEAERWINQQVAANNFSVTGDANNNNRLTA